MKLHKTKNAISGTFFGILLKVYQILVPFIIRTIFLYYLGVEYLGLNSLFTSIIQVLNVAELGVGSALVFSMYEPIAKDNKEKISALMYLYKKYYRIIGCVVLSLGIILIPFLDRLILNDIPNDVNIYILYLMNLGATVLSYWLFAYRNSLFTAHQRNDVISIVGLFVNTCKYLLEIFVLIVFKNYYMYLTINILSQILNNIIVAILSKKYYPDYIPKGKIDVDEKRKIDATVKDLFTCKIGQIIIDSFDTIVISAFLGLTQLAIYQNYYYIISSIIAIFKIIFKSLVAGVGNSLIIDKEEKNISDFYKINYLYNFLLNFCVSALICLYSVFMKIWVKNEELILGFKFDILFTVYFIVYVEMLCLELYKDAAGNWHKDRYRPIITAIVNLTINLSTVHYWGLYGIIISTIISILCVNIPWIFIRLFKDIFPNNSKIKFLLCNLKYKCMVLVICLLTYYVCNQMVIDNIYIKLFINALICIVIPNICFVIGTRKQMEFKYYMKKIGSWMEMKKIEK